MSAGAPITAPRVLAGVLGLALIWIAVYWFYEPGKPGGITIEPTPVDDGERVAVDPVSDPPGDAAVDPPIDDPAGPRLIPPKFTTHTVAQGESWGDISQRYYGTRAHAEALVRANPFKSATNLRAGDEILVPEDPANIQGIVENAGAGEPEPKPSEVASPPPPLREYTVGKNETFGGISKKVYGTTARWRELYDFNRERLRLSKPEALREGQVLHIPPEATSADASEGR